MVVLTALSFFLVKFIFDDAFFFCCLIQIIVEVVDSEISQQAGTMRLELGTRYAMLKILCSRYVVI
jgi:hypothetical protein